MMKKNTKSLMPTASWLGNVKSAAIVLLIMLFSSTTAWAVATSGKCGQNLTWEFTSSDSTLTIRGTGEMKNYGAAKAVPWYKYRNKITKVKLQEGLTNIGAYAFYQLTYLKEISIPASVSTIGVVAFDHVGYYVSGGCTLTVEKGSKLNDIKTDAFYGFKGKTDLRECTKLTTIGNYIFTYYSGTIQLPLSLETIKAKTFERASPTEVTVAYNNGILYVNGKEVDSSAAYKEYDIMSYLGISDSGSNEVTFSRMSFDGIPFSFDETCKGFVISNEQELISLSNYVNSSHDHTCKGLTFKLTADLDMRNCNFVPIGFEWYFEGHFDGQGHTISNLSYSSATDNIGLFYRLDENSIIENVTLINPEFRGKHQVGGIVATIVEATIQNCAVVGGTISGDRIGGIVGAVGLDRDVIISNCSVVGTTISGSESVGCIIGENVEDKTSLNISDCLYDVSCNKNICGVGKYSGSGNVPVYHLNLGYGITSSDVLTFGNYTVAKENASITLNANRAGYEFVEFKSEEVTIEDGQFTMPKKNVSVTAVWEPMKEISLKGSLVDGLNWTTFYCGDAGYRIADDEEACAYTATVGEDIITLHMLGKVIPKGTAVIIVAEDDNISMTRDDVSAAEYKVKNDLRGVDEPTLRTTLTSNDTKTLYMLSNKNNNFGFHSFGAANVPARKAYFTVASSAKARSFSMVFEDEATAVKELRITNYESPVSDSAIYDLNGRAVNAKNLKPGIYVKNGKKIVIK